MQEVPCPELQEGEAREAPNETCSYWRSERAVSVSSVLRVKAKLWEFYSDYRGHQGFYCPLLLNFI